MGPLKKFNRACLDPELMIPISRFGTQVFKTGLWSNRRPVFLEKSSPCRVGCPNGNDIPRVLKQMADGKIDQALAILLEENPLPGVCGRVCYHPCQDPCNRGGLDEVIAIRDLERAVSDSGRAQPSMLTDRGKDHPVAVIGSGPAGLSSAYHLARMGHPVTIFEAREKPGGLLAFGIPEYRLPKDVLERELNRIFSLAITLKTGQEISSKEVVGLTADFGSVLLAVGAANRQKIGIQGEALHGVVAGLDFLVDANMQSLSRGARVVVIGGGSSAVDAARTAVRRGAATVTILYRRSQRLMPAFPEEVNQAMEEGIQFQFSAAPVAFTGIENRVTGVQWTETQPSPIDSIPNPLPESEKTLSCELAVVAIGQGVEGISIPQEVQMEKGRIWVDSTGRTSRPGLFAGGDLTPNRESVVDAIASGKMAAFSIHRSLVDQRAEALPPEAALGEGPSFSIEACFRPVETSALGSVVQVSELDLLGIELKPSVSARVRVAEERVKDFSEVHDSLTPEEAREEASRCFYCGTCTGCDRCWRYCPECAMLRPEEKEAAYRGHSDYCKGCGICASECIRGVLEMGEES